MVDLDGASPDDHDGPGQQVVDLVESSHEDPGDQARQDDADHHDEPKVPEVLFQHYIACVEICLSYYVVMNDGWFPCSLR